MRFGRQFKDCQKRADKTKVKALLAICTFVLVSFSVNAEDSDSEKPEGVPAIRGLLNAQTAQEAGAGEAAVICEIGSNAIDSLNQKIAEKKLVAKVGLGTRHFERPFSVSPPSFPDPKFSNGNERVCVTITKK